MYPTDDTNGTESPAPRTFKLHPVRHPGILKLALSITAVAMAVSVVALIVAIMSLRHSNSQTAQIHNLYSANTRLAGELAAEQNQLTQLSARLAAASPSNDKSLINCADLRRMKITVVNGASIQAGGSIGISQSAVAMPMHCARG